MDLFSEFIKFFKGKTAVVNIIHKIYGGQKSIIRNFQPFCSNNKIGFLVNDHEVFLYFDEIESTEFNGNEFIINGSLQKMSVKLI